MSVLEKDYWVGFSVFPGVGTATFKNLLKTCGSAKNAWEASKQALLPLLKEKKTNDFLLFRKKFDFSDYKNRLSKKKVIVITLEDELYPPRLKQIKNPPFVLYIKGDISVISSETRNPMGSLTRVRDDKKKVIAIVGTRKITQYGRDVTEMFTTSLVSAGCSIVSGLAMGVDTIAHQTTIDTGEKTIAVLGCGVDCCYPKENEKLYDAIIETGGAIISEIPLGMGGNIGTFPARNRIVAAISDAVLVTEGAIDSGALITAQFGIEYGKKVFAIPGPITSSLSKGPYALIEKGALLVTKPEDILRELQITNYDLPVGKAGLPIEDKRKIIGDNKEETLIIALLEKEALGFDEIVRKLHMDSATVGQLLSLMEIKGYIKTSSSGLFSL